jgi:hypothetical protein
VAVTQIRGDEQILEKTIDLGRLFDPFLSTLTGDWDLTNGANDATVVGLRDPVGPNEAATKGYVDSVTITPPIHIYNDVKPATNASPIINLTNMDILVGTERIYLNGVRQIQGATEDYTIDYPNGVVTFTKNLKTKDVVVADYNL